MADAIGPDLEPPDDAATAKADAEPQTPEDLLDTLNKDFNRIKRQKARPTGGIEGTTLLNLCFLHDEQYVNYRQNQLGLEPQDENKLYLSFNLITPRYQKLMGRLSAFNAPFKARPDKSDPEAIHDAEIVDRMIVATDEKLDEPSRMRERLHWILAAGTAFEYVPWVPNATLEPMPQFDENGQLLFKDTTNDTIVPEMEMKAQVAGGRAYEEFDIYEEIQSVGEVGSEVLGPLNVFVDQTTKSIQDIPPDGWVHIARIKTIGWIKENFDEDVEANEDVSLIVSRIRPEGEASGGVFLRDLIPLVQGSRDANDPPLCIYVESYQPTSTRHPKGRYVCWVPEQKILHDDENPYEEIPLVDFHFSPVVTNFWTKAFITPLISPQRFINKRMSQLGEQSNATLYSNLLLGPGLSSSDIPADHTGVIQNGLNEQGGPNILRLAPPEIPQWFLQSIELAVKLFNDTAGGMDLLDADKFPGQLRGPMAVPMLQEIMDTQWGPLFQHLGERLSRVKQMRLNRIKQFYPPVRTMHYTDKTQKDEVLEFHTEKILRAGTNFSVTVDRGSILPELRALREARLTERLNGPLMILYMDERTGRLDKSKIAADLQFGDTGREGRESKYRKLGKEIAQMLWSGKQAPPVQPFYDHHAMLDELEDEMASSEFLKASPQIQQLFADRWQQHTTFLQQEAANQAQMMQGQQMHSAIAQATQMAAAKAASEAVDAAHQQIMAQQQQPTGQIVANAQAQATPAGQMPGRPVLPPHLQPRPQIPGR